ncbi:PAS domain-containing sensor histidine kinase [Flaviaesturariibacter amylovorans]|uniref:histidine kinase n=1 Tax=Flaviaesturariibacter amylovorans TaxID=1084520 RepID=A0ABP8HNW6_9BACT
MAHPTIELDLIRMIGQDQDIAFLYLEPLWSDTAGGSPTITDFRIAYCNAVITQLTGREVSFFEGKQVLADHLPDPEHYRVTFEQCVRVYEEGAPVSYTYYSPNLKKYLSLKRVKTSGGVLTTVYNRTQEYESHLQLEQQTLMLQHMIDSLPYGVSLYESVRDAAGEIVDFRLQRANQQSVLLTGIDPGAAGSVRSLAEENGRLDYFERCKQVVYENRPLHLEHYSEAKGRWLSISVVKFNDGHLLSCMDITNLKELEQQNAQNALELSAIFEGSLSGVYTVQAVTDDRGRLTDLVFLRANGSFYRIFATTPEQIIGKSLRTITGNDDPGAFLQYAQEVLDTGVPGAQTLHYTDPERWYDLSIVKLDARTLLVNVNDVTEHKLALNEIGRQKNVLASIMKQSPNGLSITRAIRNEQGEMVDAIAVMMNDACERFNGVPNDVIMGSTMGTLDPGILESPLFQAAKGLQIGDTFRTEYYLPPSGRWLELAVAKMDDDHFINVFTDITPVKESQERLQLMIDELTRSNRNLEEFAYAASHDLKEPIRKVQYFSDMLRQQLEGTLTEGQRRQFDRMERANRRMQLLIDDLLAYAQATKGTVSAEAIDLNKKLQAVLEDLELEIRESGATVEVGELPVLQGDRRQFQQLLQNLVGNALKYRKANVAPRVRISSDLVPGSATGLPLTAEQQGARFWELRVQDNGIGFEQHDAERIFNVFTRLHGNAEYSGSGVGLAIVRKVVTNHNGYIVAEGRPGEGALFRVYFPAPAGA